MHFPKFCHSFHFCGSRSLNIKIVCQKFCFFNSTDFPILIAVLFFTLLEIIISTLSFLIFYFTLKIKNSKVNLFYIFIEKWTLTKPMRARDYFCPSMKLKDLNLHKTVLRKYIDSLFS